MSAAEKTQEVSLREGIAILKEKYTGFQITTPDQFIQSAEVLKTIKRQRDAVVEFFHDSKQKAHATWKAIIAQEKSFTDQLDEVERKIKGAIRSYQAEEERKQREEERRLQEIAEAEAKKAQETLLAQAEEVKKAGNTEAAEQITNIAAQVEAAPVHMQTAIPKAQGVSFRKNYVISIIDKKKFIEAALSEPTLLGCIEINIQKIKKIVTAVEGKTTIPGVSIQIEKNVAIRK